MKKAKVTTKFVCQECGYDTPEWLGKCPECGNWNSLREFKTESRERRTENSGLVLSSNKPQTLREIVSTEKSRIQTEYEELNTVLGGGIVAGSATIIAGDPGVGKSTLLLQLALSLAQGPAAPHPRPTASASPAGARRGAPSLVTPRESTSASNSVESKLSLARRVLYVSGEESVEQIKMRAERIVASITSSTRTTGSTGDVLPPHDTRATFGTRGTDDLLLLAMTDTDAIVAQIEEVKPDLVIIDSIQTVESQNVSGLSGSVGQVRYGALQFVRVAKQQNVPIIIVGHVTKEGMVAGPMVLSHMVDTVLFLEGEKFAKTRILRSLKNRFGPVDEVGIFLMEEEGMVEAKNPEQLFIANDKSDVPGSVLVATLEGSRAFLVELQALTVTTRLPMPRRVVSGVDSRRVELLLAVLQKHCRLPLDTVDVFVNVAGGLRLSDPAIDLGICLAVYSSLTNKPLPKTVGIGEVGLLGELRMVAGIEKRTREAQKLGFKQIITAKNYKSLTEVIKSLTM